MATGVLGGDPTKVGKAGDTMTGPLVLPDASPAASEAFVEAHEGDGGGSALQAANNLSDLSNIVTARSHLGLGTAAVAAATDFDSAGAATTAAGGRLAKAANLDDLPDLVEARGNLGLGTSATHDVPATGNATATEVVLGNDTRLSGGAAAGAKSRARSPFDTSGTLTLSASTRAQLTANDLTLTASAGDLVEIGINLFADQTKGGFLAVDAATRVSGADNHWVSSETGTPRYPGDYPSWYLVPGQFDGPFSPVLYLVDASDVVAGNVTLRLYGEADGDRDVLRSATFPLRWYAINHGGGS